MIMQSTSLPGIGSCDHGASGKSDARLPLRSLRALLAEGWDLVQPIFVRPQWAALDDHAMALHFVLQRDHATRLVTMPETRAVLRFVRQRAWKVQGRSHV